MTMETKKLLREHNALRERLNSKLEKQSELWRNQRQEVVDLGKLNSKINEYISYHALYFSHSFHYTFYEGFYITLSGQV